MAQDGGSSFVAFVYTALFWRLRLRSHRTDRTSTLFEAPFQVLLLLPVGLIAPSQVKIAYARATSFFPDVTITARFHVGDTPNDILAAENGGATAVGVCTGIFDASALSATSKKSALILPNLSDLANVLMAFDLC